jgi:hypothetical protein
MAEPLTFVTRSERLPTVVASLVFLVPGLASVIFGLLTLAGLTWVENPSNGILVAVTGSIWAAAGVALYRFQRWVSVDPEARQVRRGTRVFFEVASERFPFDRFAHVEVRADQASGVTFYLLVLAWAPDPRRQHREPELWLQSFATADEARHEGTRVAEAMGRRVVDRTRGQKAS